jgi:hypothetical protein
LDVVLARPEAGDLGVLLDEEGGGLEFIAVGGAHADGLRFVARPLSICVTVFLPGLPLPVRRSSGTS